MHYYKFNVASWAKDTGHLSLKEEGIYLRLVNYYYDTEKPIPIKTQLVLRKLRIADESELVNLILEEFFVKTKSGWTHKHCDKLISEYQRRAETNRKNAKLGGRPKNKNLAKPNGFSEETELKPKGIPNQELKTNNDKPENNKPKLDWSATQMSESEISEIKQLRKNSKAPVTQRVIDQLAKQFDLSRGRGYSNSDIMNEWSIKGWRSYKDEWMKSQPSTKNQQTQPEYNHEEARQREIEALRRNI